MKRSRLKPMSAKRRASLPDRERVRLAVFERDGGCMFWAHALRVPWDESVPELPECHGPLTLHHLRKASAGGAYSIENGLTLCAGHNGFVEDFPDLAHAMGLVIRNGDPLPWEAS